MKHGRWIILILALSLFGCVNVGPQFESVPSLEPSPPRAATFTTGEDFKCWTAPAPDWPNELKPGTGQLILSVRTYDDDILPNGVHLYRFDFSTATYSLLASDIDDDNPDKRPFTSPDGKYVWYAHYQGPSDDSIFIYSLTDDSVRQVPFPYRVDMIDVVWSADGQCLIDTRSGVAYRLADGAIQHKTIPGRYQSPDGQWWADESDKGIRVIGIEWNYPQGNALHLPITNDSTGRVWFGLTRWSPNRNILAFAYGKAPFYYLGTVRLVYFEQDRAGSFRDIPVPGGVASFAWSPDGRQLLIAESKLDVKSLYIYDTVTDEMTALPQPQRYGGAGPVWSPDGTGLSQLPPPPSNAHDAASAPSIWHVFWVP